MKIYPLFLVLGLWTSTSCHHRNAQSEIVVEPTITQRKLLDEGWTIETPNKNLTEAYGIKPIYGTQDNYFDIAIGIGCNVVVKIVDRYTDRCIRCVYVEENSTTTVQEIPQGVYYLKLAYGYDWMVLNTVDGKIGKFTRNVHYEKSQDVFDFGEKNSRDEINYRLEINVVNSKLDNNFLAIPIDEEEFMR